MAILDMKALLLSEGKDVSKASTDPSLTIFPIIQLFVLPELNFIPSEQFHLLFFQIKLPLELINTIASLNTLFNLLPIILLPDPD